MCYEIHLPLKQKGNLFKYSYCVFSDGGPDTTDEELISRESFCRMLILPHLAEDLGK